MCYYHEHVVTIIKYIFFKHQVSQRCSGKSLALDDHPLCLLCFLLLVTCSLNLDKSFISSKLLFLFYILRRLNSVTKVLSSAYDILVFAEVYQIVHVAFTNCLLNGTKAPKNFCEPANLQESLEVHSLHFSEQTAKNSCLLRELACCPELEKLE